MIAVKMCYENSAYAAKLDATALANLNGSRLTCVYQESLASCKVSTEHRPSAINRVRKRKAVEATFRELVGVELLVPKNTSDIPEKLSESLSSGGGVSDPGGVDALMNGIEGGAWELRARHGTVRRSGGCRTQTRAALRSIGRKDDNVLLGRKVWLDGRRETSKVVWLPAMTSEPSMSQGNRSDAAVADMTFCATADSSRNLITILNALHHPSKKKKQFVNLTPTSRGIDLVWEDAKTLQGHVFLCKELFQQYRARELHPTIKVSLSDLLEVLQILPCQSNGGPKLLLGQKLGGNSLCLMYAHFPCENRCSFCANPTGLEKVM